MTRDTIVHPFSTGGLYGNSRNMFDSSHHQFPSYLGTQEGPEHQLVIGQTGSGKTNLIYNLLFDKTKQPYDTIPMTLFTM